MARLSLCSGAVCTTNMSPTVNPHLNVAEVSLIRVISKRFPRPAYEHTSIPLRTLSLRENRNSNLQPNKGEEKRDL